MHIIYQPADPNRERDFPDVPALLAAMNKMRAQGATVWVKWTCPGCGERGISDVPNVFNDAGYFHTEKKDGTPCGALYQGTRFGFSMALPLPTPEHPSTSAERN